MSRQTQTLKKKTTSLPFYVAGLVVVFLIAFTYIFNAKIDLNGDNCRYYMLASSIAGGHGYADVTNPAYPPTNVFPPGYPLLMSLLRIFTDSFIAQKIFNGLFLLGSVLLLFFFIKGRKSSLPLAFAACVLALLVNRSLAFATMMMSETAFLFFSVLTLWFLYKLDQGKNGKPFWKDGYFYLSIFAAAYCYHIRTQGIALIVAVLGYFLFTKRWKEMLGFGAGFVLCLFPWMLRNKWAGVGQSRYLDTIALANPWRPEEGSLGLGEVIHRFFDTFRMLLTKALPDSLTPYMNVDYGSATTFGEWLAAILLVVLIIVGIWQFGKFKWFFLFYIVATFGVISLFSTPSGNRYLTALLPLMEISLAVGVYAVFRVALRKAGWAKELSPWLLLVLCLFSFHRLQVLHAENNAPFPAAYTNFFRIGEAVHKQLPPSAVVCSRKPELFYMYSKGAVTGYAWTEDDKTLLKGLLDAKVQYVVLEQLGYSSTSRYLYPAIQKHPACFQVVMHLANPDTYLLKFDRGQAAKEINLPAPAAQ
ncbi:MAG: hypothetical protein LBL81_02895 [Tannerella sp.]|jgi:hypothetical protein|nr:hypothetical protein [Tannerella sp.]